MDPFHEIRTIVGNVVFVYSVFRSSSGDDLNWRIEKTLVLESQTVGICLESPGPFFG